jgi:hypothetical protein
VRGHRLGVLQRPAALRVRGNAEDVAAQPFLTPASAVRRRIMRYASPGSSVCGQRAGLADGRAERGGLAVLADAGRGEIFIDELFEFARAVISWALPPFWWRRTDRRLPAG